MSRTFCAGVVIAFLSIPSRAYLHFALVLLLPSCQYPVERICIVHHSVACGHLNKTLSICSDNVLSNLRDARFFTCVVWRWRYVTVQACSTRVCMITGDAEDTAIAVASAVGFYDPLHHRTLSGSEIEAMSAIRLEVRSYVPSFIGIERSR